MNRQGQYKRTQPWVVEVQWDLTNSVVWFLLLQSADGDATTLTEVDLFISTQRIKVLNADSQVSTSEQKLRLIFSKRVSPIHVNKNCSHIETNSGCITRVPLYHCWHNCWHNCVLTVDTHRLLWKHWLFIYFFIYLISWCQYQNLQSLEMLHETSVLVAEQAVWVQYNLSTFGTKSFFHTLTEVWLSKRYKTHPCWMSHLLKTAVF